MIEIPERLIELFNKLWFDFEYFSYAILNGGMVGVLGITFIILLMREVMKEK